MNLSCITEKSQEVTPTHSPVSKGSDELLSAGTLDNAAAKKCDYRTVRRRCNMREHGPGSAAYSCVTSRQFNLNSFFLFFF